MTAPDPMELHSALLAYQTAGFTLVPIEPGTKGPQGTEAMGWNRRENCIAPGAPFPANHNVGLAHAYSNTMCLDIDDLTEAIIWFHARGVDIQAMLNDPHMVQINSGRVNRAKLVFRTQAPLPSRKIKNGKQDIIDFRCASREGLTVQDVLPPSIHPDTGKPYTWIGSGVIPGLPDSLLRIWEAELTPAAPERPADQPAVPLEDLRAMLEVLDPDMPRDDWLNVGMALHEATGGTDDGYYLYNDWSARGDKYDPDGDSPWGRWRSFKPTTSGITVATLQMMARRQGYGVPKPSEYFQVVADQQTQVTQQPTQPRAAFIPAGELCDGDYHVDWVIEGIVPAETLGLVVGDSGSFKSFIQIDKALHIAAGIPWCGHPVKQGTVFFIAGEGEGGLKRRVAAWCNHHNIEPNTLPFYTNTFPPNLVNDEWLAFIERTMFDMSVTIGLPVHITIDTLSASAGGLEENSAADMSDFLSKVVRYLRKPTGAAVEIVHHFGKADKTTARGSAVLRNNVDLDCFAERELDPDEKPTMRTCLRAGKSKDDEPFGELWFELVHQNIAIDVSSLVPVWIPEGVEVVKEDPAVVFERIETRKQQILIDCISLLTTQVRQRNYLIPGEPVSFLITDLIDKMSQAAVKHTAITGQKMTKDPSDIRKLVNMVVPYNTDPPLVIEGHTVYRLETEEGTRRKKVYVAEVSAGRITEVADDFLS